MPSNKFASLAVCPIFVLFLALAGGSLTANAFTGADDKRKPQSSKRFLNKNGEPQLASVRGRVLTARGQPISHAQVALYNADLDQWTIARTGSFGYYSFHDLPVSNFYVLVVIHKRYLFLDGSRTFTLEGDMFNVNFVASTIE